MKNIILKQIKAREGITSKELMNLNSITMRTVTETIKKLIIQGYPIVSIDNKYYKYSEDKEDIKRYISYLKKCSDSYQRKIKALENKL